jgi:iron complex outermembrane receptor protein
MGSVFLAWQASERLAVDVEFEYQYRNVEQNATIYLDAFAPDLSQDQIRTLLDRYDRTTFLGADWGTYPTSNFVGSVRARYQLAEDWKLRVALQKMRLVRDQNAIYIAYQSIDADGDFDAELYFQPEQVRDPFAAELVIDGRFETGPLTHQLSAGFTYLWNRLTFPQFGFYEVIGRSNLFTPTQFENPNPTSDPSFTGIREQQWSVFALDTVGLAPWLDLLAGFRFTKPRFETFFNEDQSRDSLYTEPATTPLLGLVAKPRDGLSFYVSYATGFEQGGQAPLGTENQNEVLPPVTSRQVELGLKAEIGKSALLQAALFDIERDLELVDDSNSYVQDGRQRHRGFEATLAGNLTPAVRLVTGIQYLDARILETDNLAILGNRPSNVPEWQGNIFVDWRLPTSFDLAVNGGVFAASSRFADEANSFRVDGWARLDLGLRAGFTLGGAPMTARLLVENVTDGTYFTGTAFGFFQYAAPRTVRLALATGF